MATATTGVGALEGAGLISIGEYLRTMYHPDCEFVDGRVEERNSGEFEHSRIQALLADWLGVHEKEWEIVTLTEQRVRVTQKRVRIPDVCALRRSAPREHVTETAPLLCIEILSPEDRLSRTCEVMEDYLAMGVEHLWIVDPYKRVAYTYTRAGLLKVGDRMAIEGTPIYLELLTLFAALD